MSGSFKSKFFAQPNEIEAEFEVFDKATPNAAYRAFYGDLVAVVSQTSIGLTPKVFDVLGAPTHVFLMIGKDRRTFAIKRTEDKLRGYSVRKSSTGVLYRLSALAFIETYGLYDKSAKRSQIYYGAKVGTLIIFGVDIESIRRDNA